MGQLSANLMELFTGISHSIGSGNVVNDLMVVLLLLGFIAFLFAIAAYRHTYNLKTPPGIERVNMIAGKVEKVEMNVNEFRIETVRNLEMFRGDLGYIKQELAQISGLMKVLSKGSTSAKTITLTDPEDFPQNTEAQKNDSTWGDDDALPNNPLSQDFSKKKL